MSFIDRIKDIPCNKKNYKAANRTVKDIQYIVLHYTSNINDTDVNNGLYYRDNVVGASAHYFVRDTSITCSVNPKDIAWAVGLGSMKKPYISNPTHYGICTNSNSISVEMCGGPGTREATEKTKDTTAQLVAYLMNFYNIPVQNVIKHFNVTGKNCPAWCVECPNKWDDMLNRIKKYARIQDKGDDTMTDEQFNAAIQKWLAKNGDAAFSVLMNKWAERKALEPATWEEEEMQWAETQGLIRDGQPKANVTRGQLAAILKRLGDMFQWKT